MVKIDVKPEQLFPVKCAWCGKTTNFSTIGHSHSICKECKVKLLPAGRLALKDHS